MERANIDRRIFKTKQALEKALFLLMSHKDISDITVKELCYTASINRATFNKYYSSASDLLCQIEKELFNQLELSLDNIKLNQTISTFILDIIHLIYRNKDVCKNIFNDHGNKNFIKNILYLAHDKSLDDWQIKYPQITQNNLELLFSFIANGSMGIVQDWIKKDCKDKPESIAAFIEKLCNKSVDIFV